VTESDPKVKSLDRKSPENGFIGPKTGIYCTLHFLQGCSSKEAVTWQEMTSVPSGDRKWTGRDVI